MLRMLLSCVVMALACTACSPYLYKSELTALGSSTAALRDVAQAQHEWEEADRRVNVERRVRQLHADAVAAHLPLPVPAASEACALITPARPDTMTTAIALQTALEPGCHLDLRERGVSTPGPQEPDPAALFETAIGQVNDELEWRSAHFAVAPLLDALTQYADGLAALADASDAQSLAAAQSELASGIGGLAASIGHASEVSDRQAVGQALGNTLGLLWQARLDRRRLETLRTAVTQADTALRALEDPITTYLDEVRARQVQRERRELFAALLAANIELRADPPDEEAYVAMILALDQKVAEFAARARNDPSRAFETLIGAHHAMQLAVNDRRRQFAESMSAVAGFVEAAAALEAAAAAFDKSEDTGSGAT